MADTSNWPEDSCMTFSTNQDQLPGDAHPQDPAIQRAQRSESRTANKVVILLQQHFGLLNACGPLDVFSAANYVGRKLPNFRPYEIEVVSDRVGPVPSTSGVALVATRELDSIQEPFETLLIPGGVDISSALRPEILRWIVRTSKLAGRVASVCTGAFVLAATGLLDNKRATTHWEACERLAKQHPKVTVEPDAIYVRDGKLWSSAGVSAGIDLALALVEDDYDRQFALQVAREMVVYLKRPGGQSQFSALLQAQTKVEPELRELIDWMPNHLDSDLSVQRLAERAKISERHFARLFRQQTQQTPGRYVEDLRLRAARQLLDEGAESLDEVARTCGFGSTERLRRTFSRRLGLLPSTYRQTCVGSSETSSTQRESCQQDS